MSDAPGTLLRASASDSAIRRTRRPMKPSPVQIRTAPPILKLINAMTCGGRILERISQLRAISGHIAEHLLFDVLDGLAVRRVVYVRVDIECRRDARMEPTTALLNRWRSSTAPPRSSFRRCRKNHASSWASFSRSCIASSCRAAASNSGTDSVKCRGTSNRSSHSGNARNSSAWRCRNALNLAYRG
jgi:hypothetical protein